MLLERQEKRVGVVNYLKSNRLYFDGAMGTMLQKAGLEAGGLPEVYNIEHPDVLSLIHI